MAVAAGSFTMKPRYVTLSYEFVDTDSPHPLREKTIVEPIVLVLIGLAVLVGAILARGREKDRREGVARRLGLQVDSSLLGGGKLSGDYRGMAVEVEEFRKGNGRHSRAFVQVKARLACELPDGLKSVHEDDLAQLGKIFGLQDIIVGHAKLDKLAVIKAKDVDRARAFLKQPGVADALAEFFDRYESARLANGEFKVERPGHADGTAELVLEAMADLAEVLAGERRWRASDADLVDAGYGDAHKIVEEELARRKRDPRSYAGRFDPDDLPKEAGSNEEGGAGEKFGPMGRSKAPSDEDGW